MWLRDWLFPELTAAHERREAPDSDRESLRARDEATPDSFVRMLCHRFAQGLSSPTSH